MLGDNYKLINRKRSRTSRTTSTRKRIQEEERARTLRLEALSGALAVAVAVAGIESAKPMRRGDGERAGGQLSQRRRAQEGS